MHQYNAIINVFKYCLRSVPAWSNSTAGSYKRFGRKFHANKPSTQKACQAKVLNRQHGTARSCWLV